MAKEYAIIIHSDPYIWEVKKLTKVGQLLFDKMTGKAYCGNGRKITIIKGKKQQTYVLLDGEKGVVLEPEITKTVDVEDSSIKVEKDETVLTLKTDPELIYQTIESGLLLKLFRIKPAMGQVLAGIVLGLVVGFLLGGILF